MSHHDPRWRPPDVYPRPSLSPTPPSLPPLSVPSSSSAPPPAPRPNHVCGPRRAAPEHGDDAQAAAGDEEDAEADVDDEDVPLGRARYGAEKYVSVVRALTVWGGGGGHERYGRRRVR